MFKNRGSPCYFLSSRGQRIRNIAKIEPNETVFVYNLAFIFNGVSSVKTDLHNKYVIQLCFEQDNLLNLIVLGVYAKR